MKSLQIALAYLLCVAAVAICVIFKFADLAMLATLAMIPITIVALLRRDLTLLQKARRAGPVPYVIPIVLFLAWSFQNSDRIGYFAIGAICSLVYLVSIGVAVRFLWLERG